MTTRINIDAGGTFTDCFTLHDGEAVSAKTPTTEHDMSECFFQGIRKCASQLDVGLDELIADVDSIRYSTTTAMNRLIERKGPKLGLLTTAGVQDYPQIGRGPRWADGLTDNEQRNISDAKKPEYLVPDSRTKGIRERVDSEGTVLRPLDEDHAREQIRDLVDRGARAIVVNLLWSYEYPEHEQRIRELVREEYPPSYLGSIPVFLSSEVMPTKQEYERTNTTLLDAYLSELMQEHIADIKERLEAYGYEGDVQMLHNTGGMAESYKTTAVETFNGGPVAGLKGGEYLCDLLGYDKAVVTDMGGTSFDIGILTQGGVQSYEFEPVIDRWRVSGTMIESKSIGAGGGSIASVNDELGGRLEVGPESAGADPGPACYNRGGTKPTVTDADVVLGFIDPEKFYAGNQRLAVDRAEEAIETHVADPAGMSVTEAARNIRRIADGNMGNTVRKETMLRGHDPREFILYSFGGAGPLHAASYSSYLDIDTVVTTPYSPVFCAMGSATMDTLHIYEQSNSMYLRESGEEAVYSTDYESFNETVADLKAKGRRDIESEGYDPDDITYELELDMRFGGQIHVARVGSPRLEIHDESDVEAICDHFIDQYTDRFSSYSVTPSHGITVENFALKSRVESQDIDLPTAAIGGSDPADARAGSRDVLWESSDGAVTTPVYQYDDVRPGMEIRGPAVVDADYTTTAVPDDWTYRMDDYRNGILETDGATQ
ncbi:hydantoinase/oxoprolinase family protein [Halopenitus persicus]|uniref:N-methylhydantoinase A/acetophenone carboxylase n=1 Tax=Halopenitus persicus TaxID=1048396 RepID=A0A1H3EKS5_9EURY|nr:hydantoinase/oxoprolinase family protein [Halopenitus persicus]QHS17586.1 hydantoinase/oxoprolinase family protein [haloarchaeon 3A1-DGR]SDX78798.1 N-methylhydantoinase A/acetophenone carboxylase [Halopenitus persicus]